MNMFNLNGTRINLDYVESYEFHPNYYDEGPHYRDNHPDRIAISFANKDKTIYINANKEWLEKLDVAFR